MAGEAAVPTDEIRARLEDLAEGAWGLAVVSASAECGLLACLLSPRSLDDIAEAAGMSGEVAERVLDVLVAIGVARRDGSTYEGVERLKPMLTGEGLAELRAELRTTVQQSRDFRDRAALRTLEAGWVHTDPEILQAQGVAGRAAARALAEQGVPRLPGLRERLEAKGGSFLDVGIGVGVIAIEMCRAYPALRVVGLEPSEAPHGEAVKNVAAAGLSDRIEIRKQGVEALHDVDQFDLAYLPQVFLGDDAFRKGLRTVRRALRNGGWVTLPTISAPGDEFRPALARLRNTLWGGHARFAEDVAQALTEAGFTDVWVRPLGGTRHAVMGRRPD